MKYESTIFYKLPTNRKTRRRGADIIPRGIAEIGRQFGPTNLNLCFLAVRRSFAVIFAKGLW